MSPEMPDTIIAVSSPSGRSFHTIVRLSGPEAIRCMQDIFVPCKPGDLTSVVTYSSVEGNIHVQEEQIRIPATLYIMKQPYSYTREDVVEIHTIGSLPIVEMLLSALLSGKDRKGCVRLAQPGEFTKRAFLHGRIDLAQAEATMRVIRAQTDQELRAASALLAGDVSRKIKRIQDDAVSLCSSIEAAIDFCDQDIELISLQEILFRLEGIGEEISRLLAQTETGKTLPEGIDAVLYGRPNAGKSSLINALMGKKRSLVSKIPGTTRDVVTDTLEIQGIYFKLMDTAGMGEAGDAVTERAMAMSRSALKRAQIILLVFDGGIDIKSQFQEIRLDDVDGNVITIINKCDLLRNGTFPEFPEELRKHPRILTSTLTGEGIERLKEALAESVLCGRTDISGGGAPTVNARQRETLQKALCSVQQSITSARDNESYEFIALDLHAVIGALGEIAGEITTEDVLAKIFSEFCIGK